MRRVSDNTRVAIDSLPQFFLTYYDIDGFFVTNSDPLVAVIVMTDDQSSFLLSPNTVLQTWTAADGFFSVASDQHSISS